MNWNDIDFSAIQKMVDSLSEEEKVNLQSMAQNMMRGDIEPDMEQQAQEEIEETDPLFQKLNMSEEEFENLPGTMQDALEAAIDLEEYYDEDLDADYSASVLFYAKALLNACRTSLYPHLKEILAGMPSAQTTLFSYLQALNESNIHTLVDQGKGESATWASLATLISFMQLQLQRAEYDTISYADLVAIKHQLLDTKDLLLPFAIS